MYLIDHPTFFGGWQRKWDPPDCFYTWHKSKYWAVAFSIQYLTHIIIRRTILCTGFPVIQSKGLFFFVVSKNTNLRDSSWSFSSNCDSWAPKVLVDSQEFLNFRLLFCQNITSLSLGAAQGCRVLQDIVDCEWIKTSFQDGDEVKDEM